jgi:hypothetical protein
VVKAVGLQEDAEPFQFLSQSKISVDKTGGLPDWCDDDEDEGEDAGLEALIAADGAVMVQWRQQVMHWCQQRWQRRQLS